MGFENKRERKKGRESVCKCMFACLRGGGKVWLIGRRGRERNRACACFEKGRGNCVCVSSCSGGAKTYQGKTMCEHEMFALTEHVCMWICVLALLASCLCGCACLTMEALGTVFAFGGSFVRCGLLKTCVVRVRRSASDYVLTLHTCKRWITKKKMTAMIQITHLRILEFVCGVQQRRITAAMSERMRTPRTNLRCKRQREQANNSVAACLGLFVAFPVVALPCFGMKPT